jgi:hypothetical protein
MIGTVNQLQMEAKAQAQTTKALEMEAKAQTEVYKAERDRMIGTVNRLQMEAKAQAQTTKALVNQMQMDLTDRAVAIKRLKAQSVALRESLSWRITAPLRGTRTALRRTGAFLFSRTPKKGVERK